MRMIRRIRKILFVDDEPDIVYLINRVLEAKGFEVDSYTDPTLALANFNPEQDVTQLPQLKRII